MRPVFTPDAAPPAIVIADTRRWLERAVIGLNLCPFAKAPHAKGQIHYAVCDSDDAADWLAQLRTELQALAALDATERETTLLMARRKLKQVGHLVQFIEKIVGELEPQGEQLTLADHGAGKSYLGFMLYDLLLKAQGSGTVYGSRHGPSWLIARVP